jgi:putative transposase
MPSKNTLKQYSENAYYHVYNRGVNKELVFKDEEDYAVFLNLLKRYLDASPAKDNKGREYPWLHNDIELLAFCLMPNHFHCYVYVKEVSALTKLFQNISTSYGMYFNKKYKRIGPVFQGRFKASLVMEDSYHTHITRYIHLNPDSYKSWPYSSLPYFMGNKNASWINTRILSDLFGNDVTEYQKFLEDFKGHKEALKEIRSELANS